MALPAGRLWNDTCALAQATYPQLSPPDGFQYAGVRRPNDPTQQHTRFTLPQGTDVTQLTDDDDLDTICAKIRDYIISGRMRAAMVTDEGQRSGVKAALQRVDDLLFGPLDEAAGRQVHAAIHVVQQPDALTTASFSATMAAILLASRAATRCGDTASAMHGQWPATLAIARAPTSSEFSAATTSSRRLQQGGGSAQREVRSNGSQRFASKPKTRGSLSWSPSTWA